jgi:hypothetical protein
MLAKRKPKTRAPRKLTPYEEACKEAEERYARYERMAPLYQQLDDENAEQWEEYQQQLQQAQRRVDVFYALKENADRRIRARHMGFHVNFLMNRLRSLAGKINPENQDIYDFISSSLLNTDETWDAEKIRQATSDLEYLEDSAGIDFDHEVAFDLPEPGRRRYYGRGPPRPPQAINNYAIRQEQRLRAQLLQEVEAGMQNAYFGKIHNMWKNLRDYYLLGEGSLNDP